MISFHSHVSLYGKLNVELKFHFIMMKNFVFPLVRAAVYHKTLHRITQRSVFCDCVIQFSSIRFMKMWSFSVFIFIILITWFLSQIASGSFLTRHRNQIRIKSFACWVDLGGKRNYLFDWSIIEEGMTGKLNWFFFYFPQSHFHHDHW